MTQNNNEDLDAPLDAPIDGPDAGDLHEDGPANEGGFGGRPRRERGERLDSFEKLKVWQEAHQLTLKVFAITPRLPESQQSGLALQMEQTAVNVPKSIAEGFKRRGPRNKAHFYNLAQTNLEGLRYYFILCRDLGYEVDYDEVASKGDLVSRMLDGLLRSMLR
jgi:four helix bundle protein